MIIKRIDNRSSHLSAVKQLGKANSQTLGFLPDGAFDEFAERQQIIVAIEAGSCIGYLLWRVRRAAMDVAIVHVCVDEGCRRRGVARALVDRLKRISKEYRGIRISCRRDYGGARKLWKQLGFLPLAESPGRSQDGSILTLWWFDHGHPSLFSASEQELAEDRFAVVMDANVLYDLQDDEDPAGEESRALLADWLQDTLTLWVTDEVFNEIDRQEDGTERERRRTYAQKFRRLPTSYEEVQEISRRLRPLFPEGLTPSDESDILQVAHAIAGGAVFFVTRDGLLTESEIAEAIHSKFGLSIVRPCNIIVHLDELVRTAEYQPVRLAGSRIEINRVQSNEYATLVDSFHLSAQGERKSAFRQRLRPLLADPRTYENLVIRDPQGQALALMIYARQSGAKLEIPVIRVARSPLSPTLARRLILQSVLETCRDDRRMTSITDPHLSDVVVQAIRQNRFVSSERGWVKLSLPGMKTAAQLATTIEKLSGDLIDRAHPLSQLPAALREAASASDERALLDIECSLWPAKIVDIDIPAFIVPIKPRWAMHLFDERIARGTLFGAKPELVLNSENAYYRHARNPSNILEPARILWYVSHQKNEPHSKQVRACSLLEEVSVGRPKNLYRRFRRLGVYEWPDVLAVADDDENRDIMVLRFSHTELFTSPIPWADLKKTFEQEEGRRLLIQSPTRISTSCFRRLYELGINA